MSTIELYERIQLAIHGLVLTSAVLSDVSESDPLEIQQYREEVTRLMHKGLRLSESTQKPSLDLVD